MVENEQAQKTDYGSFFFFVLQGRKEGKPLQIDIAAAKTMIKDTHVSSPGQQTTERETHTHTHPHPQHRKTHTNIHT
jgi:hypothetical protein